MNIKLKRSVACLLCTLSVQQSAAAAHVKNVPDDMYLYEAQKKKGSVVTMHDTGIAGISLLASDVLAEVVQENLRQDHLYDVPLADEWQLYTYDLCVEYGIEEHYELVLALMKQESNYTFDIISSSNDYGIMQINKFNHEFLRKELGVKDFLDPADNIRSGIYILSGHLKKWEHEHLALMCYNMGESNSKKLWKRGIYSSNYSRGIMDIRSTLEQK